MDANPDCLSGAVGFVAMSASARAGLGRGKRVCGVPRLAGRRNPAWVVAACRTWSGMGGGGVCRAQRRCLADVGALAFG